MAGHLCARSGEKIDKLEMERALFITVLINIITVILATLVYLLDISGLNLIFSDVIVEKFKFDKKEVRIFRLILGVILIYMIYAYVILGIFDLHLLTKNEISVVKGCATNNVPQNHYFNDLGIKTESGEHMTIHIRVTEKEVKEGDFVTVY